jgi:hypothetical protein
VVREQLIREPRDQQLKAARQLAPAFATQTRRADPKWHASFVSARRNRHVRACRSVCRRALWQPLPWFFAARVLAQHLLGATEQEGTMQQQRLVSPDAARRCGNAQGRWSVEQEIQLNSDAVTTAADTHAVRLKANRWMLLLLLAPVLWILAIWPTGTAPRPVHKRTSREALGTPAGALFEGGARPTRAPAHSIDRAYMQRPLDLFVAKDDNAEKVYRQKQSKELFDLLRANLARVRRFSPDPNPESLMMQNLEYLGGWIDGVIRTAPDLADELAQEVEGAMCAPTEDSAFVLVTIRLLDRMPELSSQKGFDCLFSQHKTEDPVLWQALDAWHASGLPKSDAHRSLEQSAVDPRTRDHFADPTQRQTANKAEIDKAAESYLAMPFDVRARQSEDPGPQ